MDAAGYLALLQGAGVTLSVSCVGMVFGIPGGLLLALVRWGRVPILARIAAVYVSLIRSIPMVTLALVTFFLTPSLGIEIGPLTAAMLALTLNTSAFNSEVWRGGLMDFSFDQLDAAHAFGMGPLKSFRHIVFPQLWRTCLPGLVNEMTLLIKSSPAIAVIGVVDITRAASRIGADTYEPLPPMLAATGLYVALILAFVAVQRVTERRYGQVGQAHHG